jgi:hypothetical protein
VSGFRWVARGRDEKLRANLLADGIRGGMRRREVSAVVDDVVAEHSQRKGEVIDGLDSEK